MLGATLGHEDKTCVDNITHYSHDMPNGVLA
jgi:hypothetical protein